jgi:SAM-dependent methyltransferase
MEGSSMSSVSNFYNGNPEKEWGRLEDPYAFIEFTVTLSLIKKYFPGNGAICDIGGGPGRYSFELAKRGHAVTLVDLSDGLLEIARQKNDRALHPLSDIICADAKNLEMFPSGSYDAILLLGPLYHLLESSDRLAALGEVHRLLKPGGIALVAYLNSWGIARYGIAGFPQRYEDGEFVRAMQGEVAMRGAFENFTECFWTTPPLAVQEITSAQFTILGYAGCESVAAGMKAAVREMAHNHPKGYANLLEAAAELAEAEHYRDTSEHMLFAIKKHRFDSVLDGRTAHFLKAVVTLE